MDMEGGSGGFGSSRSESLTSRSHLLATAFRGTSNKNKAIGGFVLSVLLISGAIAFIQSYHKSNADTFSEIDADAGNSELLHKNVFLIKTRDDEPMALAQQRTTPPPSSASPQQRPPGTDNLTPSVTASTSVTPPASSSGGKRHRVKGQKPLPVNASTMHPVSLINEMKIDPRYNYLECKDGNTTLGFKADLRVDISTTLFEAYGKSKKQARRIAAGKACKELWNLDLEHFEDIPEMNDIVNGCSGNN